MKTLSPKISTLLFLCVLTFTNCKKEDPSVQSVPLSFSFDLNQYSSGQLAILNANKDIEADTYKGSFGDSSITLTRTENDSALVFVVPFMADGNYSIAISGLSLEQSLVTNVVNIKVNDPQSVIGSFNNTGDNQILQLESINQNGGQISAQDIQAIKDMQTGFTNLVSQLSPSEKEQLAVFIRANNLDNFSLNPISVPDSFVLKTSTPGYPSIQWSEMGAKLIVNGTAAITTGYIFANLVALPDPTFLSKAGAAAAGIALCTQFMSLLEDMRTMARFTGIPEQVSGWVKKSQNVLVLSPNSPELLGFKIDFRVLKQSDANSSSGSIKAVAELINNVNNRWINFKLQLEQIKSWFMSSSPSVQSPVVPVSNTLEVQSLLANPGFVKIENVTNGVALTSSSAPNGIELTVTSGTATNFTFDIVYENPEMGNPIRKTINAKVEPYCGSTFTDPRDGQIYDIVQIGNQCWMAENLSYSTPNSEYYEGTPYNLITYGRLYNGTEVKTACPPGWHLPSAQEWRTLIQNLGGESIAGGKLKSTTSHWDSPNVGATNSSGFTALPAGHLWQGSFGTGYSYLGSQTFFLSSTDTLITHPWTGIQHPSLVTFELYKSLNSIKQWAGPLDGTRLYSCRCVKD